MEKALITHGIKNVKIAIAGAMGWAEPVSAPYAKLITLPIQNNDTKIFADDAEQLILPADQGYAGNLNFTTRDENIEKILGYLTDNIDGGLADVKINGYKQSCIYYETTATAKDGSSYTIKNWLYACTLGKPQISSTGDTESVSVEDVQYPLSVKGVLMLKAGAEADIYKDAKGMEVSVRKWSKTPDDDGYETFENAVPAPRAKTVTP